jgi:hypothetical protein
MRIIAFIAVLLFCSGYWIYINVFPTDVSKQWDLRIAIFTLIFAMCFFTGWHHSVGFTRAIFLVGIVFCGGDIVDRYFFHINEFQWNDLLLFLFALIYLPKEYAREIKTST